MQQHTLRLTPPAGKPMPIVIPSYNGARKQANLTPLLAMLLHKLGFPVVVHGVSHDPTRVLTETILPCWTFRPPCTPDRLRRSWRAMNRCISRWGPSVRRWRNSWRCAGGWAYATAPYRQAGHAVWRRGGIASLQRVASGICSRVANFFRETGGRALLMHGTEGEVYANPQRCPQISLIDEQGVRVLYERQTEMAAEAVVLPTSKDPEVTARWIERCVAGVEPVPNSLKTQLACCLLACGEVTSLEQGLSRVNDCW